MSTAPDRAAGGARRLLPWIGLVLVGLVLPLAIASHYGALGVPRSDDWSYTVTLFRWVDTGHLDFNRWVSMTLLGQLAAAAPVVLVFGRSVWVVQVFSACVGFVGLVFVVLTGRRLSASGRGAFLLVLTVALGPLWASLTTTFMTDVPSMTAQIVALYFAVRAFGHRFALRWYAAALAAGVVGFSVRQYGLATVAAIGVVGLIATRGRDRRNVAIGVALAVVACGGVLVAWAGVPHPLPVSPKVPTAGSLSNTVVITASFLRLIALLLVPVIVWAGPVRTVRRAWRSSRVATVATAAVVSGWLAVGYLRSPRAPFVGNYVDRLGTLANDVVAGERPPVMPTVLFGLLIVIASVSALVLVLAAVPPTVSTVRRWTTGDRRLRRPAVAVVAGSTAALGAAYAVAVLVDLPIFDRYALVLVPLVGFLILADPATDPVRTARRAPARRGAAIATVAAFVGLAVVGFGYASDSAAFDATRWSVATRTVRHGYRPLQVYGGFEWLGWHKRLGPPRSDVAGVRLTPRPAYFDHLCVNVTVDPDPRRARRAIVSDEVRGGLRAPVPIVSVRVPRSC